MATVYQKRGRWYLAWGSRENREAIPLGPEIRTRAEAVKQKKLFEADQLRLGKEGSTGKGTPAGIVTLRQAINAFASDKRATAAASTQIYYRTHFRNFQSRLPIDEPLSAFSTEILEEFRDKRRLEVAAETVNKELGTLRAVWSLALKRRMTALNPIAAVVDLREEADPDSDVDAEESRKQPASRDVIACAIRTLRARGRASPEHREPYRLFVHALRIGYYSGMRLGEMCRLRPADIRLGAMRVRATRVKGGMRWTAIPTPIVRLLKRLARRGHETVLVCARGSGRAYSSLRQLRDEFVERYPSLKTAGFHSLRHALATAGADVLEDSTRKDLFGHSQIEQTEGYTHRSIERLREAQDAVRKAERERRLRKR